MNTVHLHLMLTHVPLFGTVGSLVLLLIAFWRKSDELKRVAFGLIVLTALLTLPLYFTGEPAEEAVEHLSGVSKATIEVHEDAAKIAFVSMLATGAVALASFAIFRRARAITKPFTGGVLLMVIVTVLLMGRTANLGGKVRHTEIGGVPPPANTSQQTEHEKDH